MNPTPTNLLLLAAAGDRPWHDQLVTWTEELCIAAIVAGMLMCIYRMLRGPHLADRALAVDTLGVELVGLVIIFTMRLGSLVLFDGILVLSLLGFAGSVAMAQYIGRPRFKDTNAGLEQQNQPGGGEGT
jgi:multicomponent K+:H+ antiporter subunit F